jgi:predicted chitinase
LNYSVRVATAYLKRHAPTAWAAGDVETLARVHNGGPKGHLKPATKGYGAKVKALSK